MMSSRQMTEQELRISSSEINISDLHQTQVSIDYSQLKNVGIHPFDCIGLLKFTNSATGSILNATAALISPDLILTCAHNIFNKKHKAFYNHFQFYPTNISQNSPPIRVIDFRICNQFKKDNSQNESYDYGLLKLMRPVIRAKYLEIKYNFKTQHSQIELYGYPKPLKVKKLFGKVGKIISATDSLITHNIYTQPGQNGSPIFINHKNEYHLVGIHKGYQSKSSIGVIINKNFLVNICKWQSQMHFHRIKFSQYSLDQHQKYQSLAFNFNIQNYDHSPTNMMEDLNVQWETTEENHKKFQLTEKRITRINTSLFAVFTDRHRQATSKNPLPIQGKYTIKFKIIKYGVSEPYDPIYFGITTKACKAKDNNSGRQRQSIAYMSSPKTFEEDRLNFGSVLMDGSQVAYGPELFIEEGGQLKLFVDCDEGELTWDNGAREVTHKYSKWYKNAQLFLFVSLNSHQSCVSWKSIQEQVWM